MIVYIGRGPMRVRLSPGALFAWWLGHLMQRFLRWLVVGACRLVRVWWMGTCAILDWLPDKGERSRADGLRVLGACVYLGASWLAGVLVIVHILLAMLR